MKVQLDLFIDGRCQGQPRFAGVTLSLAVRTEADAERCFARRAGSDGQSAAFPRSQS